MPDLSILAVNHDVIQLVSFAQDIMAHHDSARSEDIVECSLEPEMSVRMISVGEDEVEGFGAGLNEVAFFRS
jgi:hypothetical protein